MSSAAAGPAVTATSRTAMAEPRRTQACRQPRGTVSDGNVIPACSVPHDLLAAWEQQLDRARRRAGPLDLPRGAQLLSLPAVGKSEPDPARAQPVLLQRNRVIEKLADNAHVVTPVVHTKARARPPCRQATGLAPDTARSYRATAHPTRCKGSHPCYRRCCGGARQNPARQRCRWFATRSAVRLFP